jgi:DNA polymerase-4
VGAKSETRLLALGLRTIGDIAARPREWLTQQLGPQGTHLWALSQGEDARMVEPDRERKSIGAEDTFDHDIADAAALRPHIHSQAERVAARLRALGHRCRTVQLKVKLADFHLITRRATLPDPTDDGERLYRVALALLGGIAPQRVRLTGVSAEGLEAAAQLSLFASQSGKRQALNSVIDSVTQRFGDGTLTTADLLHK